MCPPTFLPQLEGRHCWADTAPLDRALALEQWHRLAELVDDAVGPVEVLAPEPWARAQTFVRELALTIDDRFVPLAPFTRRGAFEVPLFAKLIARLGIATASGCDGDAPTINLDGGNIVADSHGRLLIGVTPNDPTDLAPSVAALSALVDRPAYRVPITGGRFPHLDMALCDLNGRGWLVYPNALPGFDRDSSAWRQLFRGRPVIVAEPDDGESLACNLIVAGDRAIGPPISAALHTQITGLGIDYRSTPLTEPRKAGGGAHCLTLELPDNQ